MMRRLVSYIFAFITAALLIQACDMISGTDTPDPQITGLQPNSGPPGTMVTINGKGFSPDAANNTVTFGGTSATISSASKSSIKATVPQQLSTGPAPVEVTVGDQTASGPSFTVEQAAPGISSVEPDSGTVGTEVTIKGMNFSATTSENTITFNGTQAPVNGATKDQLKTEVPQGATDGPIKVTVKQKSTTGPDFDVITEGTMEVIASTSGDDQDSDGYTITVNGSSSKSSGINDTTYFANLEQGNHDAQISGLAQNCSISGNNPRSISISAGDTTSTTFNVACEATAAGKIAFASDRDGDYEIYLMDPDGSNVEQITSNSFLDTEPDISPDGTKITFRSARDGDGEIFTMDADGTDLQQLTDNSTGDFGPVWSPDGSKLAFARYIYTGYGGYQTEVYTMNPDGSNVQRLTDNSVDDESPSWSPDGTKITFAGNDGFSNEIYKMNSDGSNKQKLTSTSSRSNTPQWSPDGTKIVFSSESDGNVELYTMDSDGTNIQRLTNNSVSDFNPTWSPDGSNLAFSSNRSGNYEIYEINADGTNLIQLTNNSGSDGFPDYGPER